MLEAAMAVAIEMEETIEEELKANPSYSLVLVGHSMGGGCAALLATFWEHKFDNICAYLFGGPCVAPLDSCPTNSTRIINVISEGDPFRCLSLGHIADVSAAVAYLCEETKLRRMILDRTDGHINDMEMDDMRFCWETIKTFHEEVMTHTDKMFPPGRIFHVTQVHDASANSNNKETKGDSYSIHEVGPEYFRELVICPRMFDISRHLPSLYEDTLRYLLKTEREQNSAPTYGDQ